MIRSTIYFRKLAIVLTSTLCVLITLSSAQAQTRIEWHPMPSKIPMYNAKHIIVPSASNRAIPVDFSFHRSVIEGNQRLNQIALDILLSGPRSVDVVSLSSTRLLFLDRDQSSITEYDISLGTSIQIAGSGRGPGDLFFPRELVHHGEKVYVPMAGFRITEFDCTRQPCRLGKTIPVEKVNAMSIGVMNDRFVGLRSVPITSNDPGQIKDAGRASMAVITNDGKVTAEFGQTYDFGTQMMLMDAFKNGFVRYDSKTKQSILAYSDFPIVYTFDQAHKPAQTYKIDGFILGKREFDTVTHELKNPTDGFNMITQMETPFPGYLLVEVLNRTLSNNSLQKDTFEWFLVDLTAKSSTKLGALANDNFRIQFTKHGAVVFQNDEVFWIAKK